MLSEAEYVAAAAEELKTKKTATKADESLDAALDAKMNAGMCFLGLGGKAAPADLLSVHSSDDSERGRGGSGSDDDVAVAMRCC